MPESRLFLSQGVIDEWLDKGKARLEAEELTLQPTGPTLHLTPALHFRQEVTDTPDPHGLVGKVKSISAVKALEGEHYADSVVLGENAYQVEEGFLAEPRREAHTADHGRTEHTNSLERLIMEL